MARGGEYANAPYEMGDRYLKTIFAFFGVTDMETIAIENVDVVGADVQAKVDEAIERAKLLLEKF